MKCKAHVRKGFRVEVHQDLDLKGAIEIAVDSIISGDYSTSVDVFKDGEKLFSIGYSGVGTVCRDTGMKLSMEYELVLKIPDGEEYKYKNISSKLEEFRNE